MSSVFATEPVHDPRHRDPARSAVDRRSSDRYVVWALAAAAGVGGALSAAAPTGWRPADAVWCGAFAAIVTLAASRARRWPTLWFAGVVCAASIGSWWGVA